MPETPQNKAILFTNLDEWLAHLETAHPVGIDMGLVRINRVKESLGLQFQCPVITVGGTNGKGSTCAFLESILLASGYRVACHTSPHLLRFHERARIQGREATDAELLQSFNRVEQARCRIENAPTLTYFEFTTLAIMDLFANAGIDVAILEVGMGGRLDAVNIVDADCAIVTSIDLDHMAYLGNTREAIGFEKAGIFRTNASAICADPVPPQSLIDHAKAIDADLWLMGKDYSFEGDQQQWGWSGRFSFVCLRQLSRPPVLARRACRRRVHRASNSRRARLPALRNSRLQWRRPARSDGPPGASSRVATALSQRRRREIPTATHLSAPPELGPLGLRTGRLQPRRTAGCPSHQRRQRRL